MKAYTQGEIDYFCGVYAIINSCRWMMRSKHRFSYEAGCLFYQHMMQFLIDRKNLEEVLHHGTSFILMPDLLAEAREYVKKTFNMELSFSFPYAGTQKTLSNVANEIGNAEPETAYIIRFSNKEIGDHWSVITGKTKNSFKLADSYAYPAIDLQKSLWLPDEFAVNRTSVNPTGMPQPPKGKTYIAKHGLIHLNLGF